MLLGDSHLARIKRELPRLGQNVVNAAVGGATVHDLDAQAAAASVCPDDAVALSVGTNDAAPWHRLPEALFRGVLEDFLEACDAARVVVVLPPGVVEARLQGSGDRTNALLEGYRAAASAAATSVGADIMDPQAVLAVAGSSAFGSDGVHLSGRGYRALLPALKVAVTPDAPPDV